LREVHNALVDQDGRDQRRFEPIAVSVSRRTQAEIGDAKYCTDVFLLQRGLSQKYKKIDPD